MKITRCLLALGFTLQLLCCSMLFAESNPPRFDFWTLQHDLHSEDQLAELQALPNLTDYERSTLMLFEQLIIGASDVWRPDEDERLLSAKERLLAISQEAIADGDPELHAAAEEALFILLKESRSSNEEAVDHVSNALDYWARQPPSEHSRETYRDLARAATKRYTGPRIRGILRNLISLTDSPYHRSELHWDLAKDYTSGGPIPEALLVHADNHFETAIELAPPNASFLPELLYSASNHYQKRAEAHEAFYATAVQHISHYQEHYNERDRYWKSFQRLLEEITDPSVTFPEVSVIDPRLQDELLLTCRNLPQLTVSILSINGRDYVSRLLEPKGKDNPAKISQHASAPVFRETFNNLQAEPYHSFDLPVSLPPDLEPGFYQLVIEHEGQQWVKDFILSHHSAFIEASGANVLVFVSDSLTGRPAAGQEVALFEYEGTWMSSKTVVHTYNGRTDESGVAWFQPGKNDVGHRTHRYFAALVDGAQAAIDDSWNGVYRTPGDRESPGFPRAFCFTDRPAYRPGDTVHWKAILRTYQAGVLNAPPETQVEVSVTDREGNDFFETVVKTSSSGTVTGSFEIPSSVTLGDCRISLGAHGSYGSYGDATFVVEEYRLPEFQASLALDDESPSMGGMVSGTVTSAYYSGEPMPEANIEITITETEIVSGLDRETHNYRPREPRVLDKITTTSNKDGLAHFAFEGGYSDHGSLKYMIEARVTSPSNRIIELSHRVSLYNHRYAAYVLPQRSVVPDGEQSRIHVATSTPQGEPLSLKGSLMISRLIADPDCDCDESTESLPPVPVETDAQGRALVTLPQLPAGQYEVSWESPNTLTAEPQTFFVGEPEFVRVDEDLAIVADTRFEPAEWRVNENKEPYPHFKPAPYRPGSKIPVLILAPEARGHVLLVVSSGRLRDVRLIELNGPATMIEAPILREDGGGIIVTVVGANQGKRLKAYKRIGVAHVYEPLDVVVSPADEFAKPGAKQQLRLEVFRRDGSAVDHAEVAISVFDESLSIYESDDSNKPEDLAPDHFISIPRPSQPFEPRLTYNGGGHYGFRDGYYGEDVIFLDPFVISTPELDEIVTSTSHMDALREAPHVDPIAEDLARRIAAAPGLAPLRQRSNFRKSALWRDSVTTDATGAATVEFTVPDTLTEWRIEAYAVAGDDGLGGHTTSFTTSAPVAARLQIPRFLVAGDEADLSIVANNNTGHTMPIHLSMALDEDLLKGKTPAQIHRVGSGDSTYAAWSVTARKPGDARVIAAAASEPYSDAMLMPLEIIEHGFEQQVTRSGELREQRNHLVLDLPKAHRKGSVSLQINLEYGLSSLMLRALPYLINYPYTCTEQTISRLVPVTLLIDRLSREGKDRNELLQSLGFDDEQAFNAFHKKALEQLKSRGNEFGWGWFNPIHTDAYMTAYTLWGLSLLPTEVLEKDDDFAEVWDHRYSPRANLDGMLVDYGDDPDMQAWIVFATTRRLTIGEDGHPSNAEVRVLDRLSQKQDEMRPTALAWAAMAAEQAGYNDKAQSFLAQLKKRVTLINDPDAGLQTAYWGRGSQSYYTWRGNPAESTAWAVMALARIQPDSPLIDPAVKWLTMSRSKDRWGATRTTMITLMALEEVRQVRRQPENSSIVDVLINGNSLEQVSLSVAGDSWRILQAPQKLLRKGSNKIEFRREGRGDIYYAATLGYFDQSEPIQPTNSGIRISRSYYRVEEAPTLLSGPQTTLQLLEEGQPVTAGEEIEVRLLIESMADLEYLLIEDFKPAGFESLEIKSGNSSPARELIEPAPMDEAIYSGRERWSYAELRDKLRAVFVSSLPQGVWELRYRLRAETPGHFHALPAKVEAMYSPHTRGTSAENHIIITN